MDARWDRDGVVYVNDPKRHDKFIIFLDLNSKWNVESVKFGPVKKFNTLIDACMYVHESVNT